MILLNGIRLDFETFPNGETKVNGGKIINNLSNMDENQVILKYENDSDLIKLMFVKRFIDQLDFTVWLSLKILYMPYSRMDRVEGNSVFTLKYVAEFINSLKFDRIYVSEPHSDVTPALLDKVEVDYPTFPLVSVVAEKIGFDREKDFLFFPDLGASKRYSKISGYQYFVGYKTRDFATGQITGLEVLGNNDAIAEAKIIIVDDLCSYGGTFLAAGEALKKFGAAEIYLLVAHCENSIFNGKLLLPDSPINKIFTTDSILDANTADFLTDGRIVIL